MPDEIRSDRPILKAVIFDVDGTLVDSNDLHVEAWLEVFRKYGKEPAFDEVRKQIGKGGDQLLPVFCSEDELARFGKEMEERRTELFKNEYVSRVKPFPKVRELFERIRADGLRIALASSSTEAEVAKHKDTLGIKDLVDTATSADDAEESKPSPDIFEAALKGLKDVKPNEAIIVGDSPWDAIAAGKAKMQLVALLSGGFREDELRSAGAAEIYRDVGGLLENYDRSLLKTRQAIAARRSRSTGQGQARSK